MNRVEKVLEDCKELQKDCNIIKNVAKNLGYPISSLHAERLWSDFSEDLGAHWLDVGTPSCDIRKVLLSETDSDGCALIKEGSGDYLPGTLLRDYDLLRGLENLILTHQTNLDGTKRYHNDLINDRLLSVLENICWNFKKKLGLIKPL